MNSWEKFEGEMMTKTFEDKTRTHNYDDETKTTADIKPSYEYENNDRTTHQWNELEKSYIEAGGGVVIMSLDKYRSLVGPYTFD